MSEPIAGKFLLEILSTGMYQDPLNIYREYIQNAADSIDRAIELGIVSKENAEIHLATDTAMRSITITDNGLGLPAGIAHETLLSLGSSTKDPTIDRGFRGIGRLAGLGYAQKAYFITSALGENVKTIMTCDCVRMRSLFMRGNKETREAIETFVASSSFAETPEKAEAHYFKVVLEGVSSGLIDLLDETTVLNYVAATAPIDFDAQKFSQSEEIKQFFASKGFPISSYRIFRNARKLPVYKPYTRSLSTGIIKGNKSKDYVKSVEFVFETAEDGQPLYIGWLAVTDFSGQISDKALQGIRLRKGNILVGDHTTFAKFFPSEGENANKMFAGEIHALHDDLVPNSQRNDFEPNEVYNCFSKKLGEWAGMLNRNYRRGTSVANSAIRRLQQLDQEQKEIHGQISSGLVTSETKREKLAKDLELIEKSRTKAADDLRKGLEKGVLDEGRQQTALKTLEQAERAKRDAVIISVGVTNADYATKHDLPSSYTREEKKLYQRIVEVIDSFFGDDTAAAEKLRSAIKEELSVKRSEKRLACRAWIFQQIPPYGVDENKHLS